jgi:hypothetical protein
VIDKMKAQKIKAIIVELVSRSEDRGEGCERDRRESRRFCAISRRAAGHRLHVKLIDKLVANLSAALK